MGKLALGVVLGTLFGRKALRAADKVVDQIYISHKQAIDQKIVDSAVHVHGCLIRSIYDK
jgi:hypothetical protein